MVTAAAERQEQSAKRLHKVAQQAPIAVVEAATRALDSLAKHHERATFATWILTALAENDVADVAGLVDVLDRPEALADLRQRFSGSG